MDNKGSVEKIDLEELIKDFQIKDLTTFSHYLIEIWRDLARRSSDQSKGIEKLTFSKYYELPGIISDRLFSVFDKNGNGFLDPKEFIEGMTILFSETYKPLASFIFKFYDFDKDGLISKEDVRVVLSYVPLQKKYSKSKMKFEQNEFQDRVESQNELYELLKVAFDKKEKLSESQFMEVVENVNSDIFIFILMFLLEKRPFSDETVKVFVKNQQKVEDLGTVCKTPKVESQKIASPSLKSKFVSPTLRKKTLNIGGDKNILSMYAGGNKKKDLGFLQKDQEKDLSKAKSILGAFTPLNPNASATTTTTSSKQDESKAKQPRRRLRKLLDNLEDTAPSDSGFAFGKVKHVDNEVKNDIDSDNEEDETPPLVKHEGYMYKITHSKKLKKVYFKLIGRDFYYFKNKDDPVHKGMHNLSGIYVTPSDPVVIEEKQFYNFSILYPKKARTYYIESEEECKEWLAKLNLAINFKSLLDQYEIKEKAGKGKFGLVKLAKHKETGRQVAIKIMSKKICLFKI